MTKVSIFGQTEQHVEKLNHIKFVKALESDEKFQDAKSEPKHWGNLMLLEKEYTSSKMDLIWAYNENPNIGCIYLGYWNDGVV